MIIGGLQKNSFIDYPEKISCVVFLSGCNFRCPYCQNPNLVKASAKSTLTPENVLNFLEQHRGFIDGVVISGGEPTLQPDLGYLCQTVKSMGYHVKLDTNGSRPQMVKSLIAGSLIDYVAMDIKTDPYAYGPLIQENTKTEDLLTSIELIKGAGLPYEFRTTCVKPFISPEIMERIARFIDGAKLYALQRFNPVKVLNPEFFRDINGKIDAAEMAAIKAIAQQHVQKCIVR